MRFFEHQQQLLWFFLFKFNVYHAKPPREIQVHVFTFAHYRTCHSRFSSILYSFPLHIFLTHTNTFPLTHSVIGHPSTTPKGSTPSGPTSFSKPAYFPKIWGMIKGHVCTYVPRRDEPPPDIL